MPKFLLAVACAVALALGVVGSHAPAEAASLTRCIPPSFKGHYHRTYALRKTRLPVAERVGTAVFQRNYNLQCFPEAEFVYRLRGIAVGRAVSVGGSQRELLIRGEICMRAPYEAALVRCLKRGS